jgi:hypothetical protein
MCIWHWDLAKLISRTLRGRGERWWFGFGLCCFVFSYACLVRSGGCVTELLNAHAWHQLPQLRMSSYLIPCNLTVGFSLVCIRSGVRGSSMERYIKERLRLGCATNKGSCICTVYFYCICIERLRPSFTYLSTFGSNICTTLAALELTWTMSHWQIHKSHLKAKPPGSPIPIQCQYQRHYL